MNLSANPYASHALQFPSGWSVIVGKKKSALSDIEKRQPFDLSGLRVDNGVHQILCKTPSSHPPCSNIRTNSCPDSATESEYVIKTVALGLGSPAGSSLTGTVRAPLRQIVARTPIPSEIEWSLSFFYRDTLSCGHQVFAYPQTGQLAKKRHYCPECKEAQLALKFPPKSVPSPAKKKGVA